MRVEIELTPSAISFSSVGGTGPYPYLVAVGSLRMAARAGDPASSVASETPSIVVSIANAENRAARILSVPLRARAVVYDDAEAEFFAGTISQVAFGRALDLTIES